MDNDLLLSQDRLAPHCVPAVIARLLAIAFLSRMQLGRKFEFFLNLTFRFGGRILLNYADNNVVDFIEFSWPINYDAGPLPTSTCQTHQSALAHFDDVNHQP